MDHEGRLRELNDLVKCSYICTKGVPENEERDKGAEGLVKKSYS